MPSEQSLKVLGIVASRPGERISKKELIEELQELKIIPSSPLLSAGGIAGKKRSFHSLYTHIHSHTAIFELFSTLWKLTGSL